MHIVCNNLKFKVVKTSQNARYFKVNLENKLFITTNFSIFVGKYDIKTKKEEMLKISEK